MPEDILKSYAVKILKSTGLTVKEHKENDEIVDTHSLNLILKFRWTENNLIS